MPGVTLDRGADGVVTRAVLATDGAAVAKAAMLRRPGSHLPQHVILAADAAGAAAAEQVVRVHSPPAALPAVTVARHNDDGVHLLRPETRLSSGSCACVRQTQRLHE